MCTTVFGGVQPAVVGELVTPRRYVYDRWNLLAELKGNVDPGLDNDPLRTYAWGLDLSNSEHGAGGVGGLLFESDEPLSLDYHAQFDGNGNLVRLVDSAGATAAEYGYGPFGEVLTAEGSYVAKNPFRFSTKYTDTESGLLYYGYRYYNASTGRWLSRDRLEERPTEPSPYSFVASTPVNRVDYLGLTIVFPPPGTVYVAGYDLAPAPVTTKQVQIAALDASFGSKGDEVSILDALWLNDLQQDFAVFDLLGWNDARDLLGHYLGKSGTTRWIVAANVLREEKAAYWSLLAWVNEAMWSIESKASHTPTGTANRAIQTELASLPPTTNWGAALGTMASWGRYKNARCTAKPTYACCGRRRCSMSFEYHLEDIYDFKPPLPYQRLHDIGAARSFWVRGIFRSNISWCAGQRYRTEYNHPPRGTDEAK